MTAATHIEVYYADATSLSENDIQRYLAQISPTEQQRYHALKRPARRHEFLLGRALLRQQLSLRYGTSPQSWPIVPNANGKPKIISGSIQPDFSISHSKGRVACAISEHGPLGLDIEHISAKRNIDALATRVFNTAEKRWFDQPDSNIKTARFYQLWTHKEAWAKATETGIAAILKGVDVMPTLTGNTIDYWFCSFNLEKNFAGSIALNKNNTRKKPTVTLHKALE